MVMTGVEFEVVNKIEAGVLEERTPFIYKGEKYILHKFTYSGDASYSIARAELFGSSMNISGTSKRYISLYTYDMMSNKTTYKMALDEMRFVVVEENNILSPAIEQNGE
jgi:hypothetical protein